MSAEIRVLVVDDDEATTALIAEAMRGEGYVPFTASDGQAGLKAMYAHRPALIVLDVNMPGMDGWTMCQRVREVSNVPVIFLTARNDADEIIRGLDLGADDYVVKPFELDVLMARVRATLRRASAEPTLVRQQVIYSDDYLTINLSEHRVVRQGEAVHLTPTEFSLLGMLVEASPRVLTYRELLEQVWGFEYIDDIDYLRVYIWHLRRKLEPDPREPIYVVNELGIGYRFEKRA